MKIKFVATEHNKTHILADGTIFEDGEIKDVPEELAQRLLREFPKNFIDPAKEIIDDIVNDVKPAGEKEAKESITKEAKGGKTKGAK